MINNNLDINRVVGHHFFTAKHCPAQLLENNLELWKKFIELVEAEYLFMTKYNNYEISIESLNDNEIPNNGKLNLDNLNKEILFNVIIKNKETNSVKNIMLSSVVNCE